MYLRFDVTDSQYGICRSYDYLYAFLCYPSSSFPRGGGQICIENVTASFIWRGVQKDFGF